MKRDDQINMQIITKSMDDLKIEFDQTKSIVKRTSLGKRNSETKHGAILLNGYTCMVLTEVRTI